MSFKYILTTKNFFSQGPCGRVSHAKGFVDGLVQNNAQVSLISDGGAENYIESNKNIQFKNINQFFYIICIVEIIKSILKKEKIVIRWRFFLPYLFFPFLLLYKNIYFEINSITGINSKNPIIRNIVKVSIYMVSKFSKVIVVSENSKKEIKQICSPKHEVYIMPNGFNPKPFLKYKPNIAKESKPNLVYFGKKQEYYDWDMLFHVYAKNKDIFDKFYIFGFNEKNDSSKIYLGSFNHDSLIDKLSSISNPILILHPSDTQMAKSGSPMKLFEYASLNLPMIVGDSIQKQASKLNGVIFYKSGNSDDLSLKMKSVARDYQSYYGQSQQLSKAVTENYTWSKIVSDWLDTLEK